MIIASRNQVDVSSGYVMSTEELAQYHRTNTLLCRDHCGPYFLDSEKDLSQSQAIEATKKTIAEDIEQGFDLIHIDTSRCISGYGVAEELISFCLDMNQHIKFEFGTEENIGVVAGIEKYKADVDFAKQFPNMEFVVAQTGSLVFEDLQAGVFDMDIVTDLVNYANEAGVKLKEHNADYLTSDQIRVRNIAGVHAMNIAPQLGVIQTRLIKELAQYYSLEEEWDAFAKVVLDSNKWSKWTLPIRSDELKVDVAGHYLYQHPKFKILIEELDRHVQWRALLEKEIISLIQLYESNL